MLQLKWEAELFSICKNLQRPQEEGWEQKAIKMVMLPHLEECIKILFVNVNRCSVSLVSLQLMALVQAQKFLVETLGRTAESEVLSEEISKLPMGPLEKTSLLL